METRSRRKMQAYEDLGLVDKSMDAELQRIETKELQRQNAKIKKRQELLQSTSYAMVDKIATVMDKWFLDPILGLFPVIGDAGTTIFVLPSIYLSLFKIKSIPLTLAVILNIVVDMLIGSIPFWIGNICDFFHRGYLKNLKLIQGYVDDDKEIINEVNQKAVVSAILIVVVCAAIYGLIVLVSSALSGLYDWISGWF